MPTTRATPMFVTFPAARAAASAGTRQITGLVAPYGEVGRTNVGQLRFVKGSLVLPADLSRIKLMDYHQNPPTAVGYGVSAQDTDAGLVMTFQCGSTVAASNVLQEALDGTRDGLSVELADYKLEADGITVKAGTGPVIGVASVPVPAFDNARVTSVAAAHHQEGNNTMADDANTQGQAPAAQAAATATVAVTGPIVDTPPAPPAEDAAPAEASMTPQAMASALVNALRGDSASAAVLAGMAGVPDNTPARRPDNLAPAAGARVSAHSPAQVAAAMGRVIRGESSPFVEAALADIVNTNVYEVVGQDSYVGQLWSAKDYTRRFVSLLRPGTLTSWRVKGWKWGVRPQVADYAGDKADVPSNSPTVLPAEAEAARLAGGHDLDRKFRDFNDTEFLQAYLQAMTESYAEKSDAKALAFILASASTPTGYDTLAAGGNIIDGAIAAADLMSEVLDRDVTPDYYLVSRTDRRALRTMVEDDKPAWLSLWGIDPTKFLASSSVPAGTVIAGLKGAGTFYELGGSPIRVEAVDIARGGIDEALFGYYATLLHDSRGIVKVDITA